jgi:hypothetical protein
MSRVRLALALALHLMQGGCATPEEMRRLVLPHVPRAGEGVVLLVDVGMLASGTEIEIRTADGHLLGIVSPYRIRAGQAAGTYSIPVPADRIEGDHVDVKLHVTASNQPKRAPRADEVRQIRAVLGPDAGMKD